MSKKKLGIITFSLFIVIALGYSAYLFAYPLLWNQMGYPTHHQVDEFYEFATELGYVPQNQIAFDRSDCSGRLNNEICVATLIFKIDRSIADIISQNENLTEISRIEKFSRGTNLISEFRDAGAELTIDGRGYSDIPFAPDYPVQIITLRYIPTGEEQDISVYYTRDIIYPVEINGAPVRKDFIILILIVKDTLIDYNNLD